METTVEQPGTVPVATPSTVIDPGTAPQTSGAGRPDLRDNGQSLDDTLRTELARLRSEDDEAAKPEDGEDKPEKGAKPEADDKKAKDDDKPQQAEKVAKPEKDDKAAKARSDDGKFAKAEAEDDKGAPEKDAAERVATDDQRQSEGRKYAEPPARFLPDARTKWANVPNEVKAEFHRVSQEMESEIETYRTSHDEWSKLDKFDKMAKQHQTSVSDALERYTALDAMMARNPIEGLRQIMESFNIKPQQYAEYIMKNPQAAQAPVSRAPDPQRPNPEIEALKAKISDMEMSQKSATVAPIIQDFAAKHSDYHRLEPQIVSVLKSGVIDQMYGNGLSPEQKLAEAYRMAGGSSPSRSAPEPVQQHSEAEPVPSKSAGTKSIRGAPANGADTEVEEPETDMREMLRKELRRITA